jgi:type IV pilus assembly protein PilW
MVGLVISLLATLVIMQVFSVFEEQKRSTTGTADAQTNGGIALYNFEREAQIAGYPLMPTTNSPLECTTLTFGSTGITSISPVTITNGTSDVVAIRYGDAPGGGVFSTIGTIVGTKLDSSSSLGCEVGNISIVTNNNVCAMSTVTARIAGNVAASPAVQPSVTLQNATAAVTGGRIACLGAWNTITFAVTNGNLTRNGVIVATDIVNIQAQYGISTAANQNQITQWVNPTAPDWAAPTVANRNRIKAIRVAIVARNGNLEKTNVTQACSAINAANPTGLCAWAGTTASPAPAIDLSADANWQRYRYRVFETTVPFKNMIWSKDTL